MIVYIIYKESIIYEGINDFEESLRQAAREQRENAPRQLEAQRQEKMRAALRDIAATPDLARDLVEVVSKSLAD